MLPVFPGPAPGYSGLKFPLPQPDECECEASCAVDKVAFAVEPPTLPVDVTVFAPPAEPKFLVPDLPTATLSCKSGTLKVVEPSPTP